MQGTDFMPAQVKQIGHSSVGSEARSPLEVRFPKTLPILQLTANCFGIAANQARHTLGFGHPALPHQEIPLPFFNIQPKRSREHPTHNLQVEGPSSSATARLVPLYSINIMEL
jgi:hypothetical protein